MGGCTFTCTLWRVMSQTAAHGAQPGGDIFVDTINIIQIRNCLQCFLGVPLLAAAG